MDRERKLLYIVAFLGRPGKCSAVSRLSKSLLDLFTHVAEMESSTACEAKLIRIYKACMPKLHPLPRSGILKHGEGSDHLGL